MNYIKIYNSLVSKAKNRILTDYVEKHHVVPRCMGGCDSDKNIVELTPEEHYIAHLLLVKIYPDHKGLVWAAIMMTGHNNGKRNNNKLYGWLRRKFQEVSKDRTGNKNGSYGTIWINLVGTTKNRKIDKEQPIPNGWKKGRVLKYKRPLEVLKDKEYKIYKKIKTDKERIEIVKEEAEKAFDEYKKGNYNSVRDFCKNSGYKKSHVYLTNIWKRYIPEYNGAIRGKAFLK